MNRLDFLGVSLLLISLVIALCGFVNIRSNTEDVLEWLPDESTAREELKRFESLFGSDDYLVITWEECIVTDPRIEALGQAILDADKNGLVENLISGPEVMARMTGRYRMSQAEVAKRLQGLFFGYARPTQTCLNVELSSHGAANRKESMALVHAAIETVPDLPKEDVVMGGYPFIATTIDRQLTNSLQYLLGPSVFMATIFSLWCLRDVALAGIVFITALGAALVSLMIVPLTGEKFGGLMSVIPALVFVLATSGCIHLIRYSLSVGTNPRNLLAVGWVPCTVSALTTIIGMMALTGSQFPAIRKFGLFCAIGVFVSWGYQLIIVPWLLERFGQPGIAKLAKRQTSSDFWGKWYEFLTRNRFKLVSVCLLLFIGGIYGIQFLRAEVEVENLFRSNSPVLQSIKKLEDQLGPLDQTELMVIYRNVDKEDFDTRVRQMKAVQQAVSELAEVRYTHSLINYLPQEPDVVDARSFARRSMYRSRLRAERDNLSNRRNLVVRDDQEIWRVSLRFPFTGDNDWEALAKAVEKAARDVLGSVPESAAAEPIEIIYTGRANLFNHAQKHLLADLFRNFLMAFTVITPVLVVALRSLPLGLLAMLPNLFPAVVLFGGLGFAGYPVDMAIAVTACIALGIAVDDTTHFLIRFRHLGGSLAHVHAPIQRAIEQCGPAMTHTTMIAGAGLIVYVMGEMLVVARFSVTISLLLFLALIADLIMMPTILLSLSAFRSSRYWQGKSKTTPACPESDRPDYNRSQT